MHSDHFSGRQLVHSSGRKRRAEVTHVPALLVRVGDPHVGQREPASPSAPSGPPVADSCWTAGMRSGPRPTPLRWQRPALPAPRVQGPPAPPSARPIAFEYSDGYHTRMKIHKYASFATIPVFAAQYAVGQELYDGSASDGTRTAHGALAATTAALFASTR